MAHRKEDAYISLPPGSLEDRELTLAYQAGDESAYEVIYGRYSQRVHNVCRRMLVNQQDAQDAAQEVFLRVHQALGRFNGRYALGAWITRIATNVCLDQLRARKNYESELCPMDEHDAEMKDITSDDEPEAWMLRKADSRRMQRILRDLPPMHRAAIVLRDFEGLSYQEVATVLSISDVQVKALIHRARQRFRRDWRASLSAVFGPTGFWHRTKTAGESANEAGAQAVRSGVPFGEVAGAATQAASHCSVLIQQCGHFVAERFAAAATVVVVGAASVAAPVGDGPSPDPTLSAKEVGERVAGAPEKAENQASNELPKSESISSGSTGSEGAASATPASSPSPSPTSTPSTGGGGSDNTSPSQPTVAKPVPSPPSFTSYMGTEGSGGSGESPARNDFTLDCSVPSFSQSLTGTFHHEQEKLTADLVVEARHSDASIRLAIQKNGRSYRYSSWGGGPSVTWEQIPGERKLTISGGYGPLYGEHPEDAGLPGSGSFQFDLSYSCGATTLRSQSLRLSR